MLLSQLLTPQRVRVPLAATDKAGVLQELSDLLVQESGGDAADVLRAVKEREQVLSTGIGFGIAIPHGLSYADRYTHPGRARAGNHGGDARCCA